MSKTKTSHERWTLGSVNSWYVLFILFLVNALNYIDRLLFAILMEPIKIDLQVSDLQLGLLSGFAFALLYATLGIPISRFADRNSRTLVLSLSLACWSAMTVMCGLAQSYVQMFFARVGVGVGEAGGTPSSHSFIADRFAPTARATAMSLFTVGAAFGASVGLAAGGWVADNYGWRIAFITFGLPGIFLGLIVWMTLGEPGRHADSKSIIEDGSDSLGKALRSLLTNPAFVWLVIGGAALSFFFYGTTQWTPAYLMRTYGLSTAEVGFFLGVIAGISGVVGTIAGGLIADARSKALGSRGSIDVTIWASILCLPFYLVSYLVPSVWVCLGGYFVANCIASAAVGPLVAAVQFVSRSSTRALASAVFMAIMSLVGLGASSVAIGFVSDLVAAQGFDGLRYGLTMAVLAGVPAALALLTARRHFKVENKSEEPERTVPSD